LPGGNLFLFFKSAMCGASPHIADFLLAVIVVALRKT